MRGNIQHFMNFTNIILSPAALKSWGQTFNISWTLLTLSYRQLHWSHEGNIQQFMNFTDIISHEGKHLTFHDLY